MEDNPTGIFNSLISGPLAQMQNSVQFGISNCNGKVDYSVTGRDPQNVAVAYFEFKKAIEQHRKKMEK